jgi:hypothetical protein
MNLIGKIVILKNNQDDLLKGSKVKIIDNHYDYDYIAEVIEGKWKNNDDYSHTCGYFKEKIGYQIKEENIDINKLLLDERKKKLKSL